jgi:molybdenum cofactor guanylyltransferase
MSFSAVILAGGKSARMGCAKAFLEFRGRPLLARQIETVRAAGAGEIFISGRAGTNYSAFDATVVVDEFAAAGPLAGIHAAMRVAKHPLLLALAVDMPEMNSEFLKRQLIAEKPMGVVPCVNARVEPLAAVYPLAALGMLGTMLASKDFIAQNFARVCVREGFAVFKNLDADFAWLFTNLNYPSDLCQSGTAK